MGQALNVHRLHFAFTITFHYIFPQLTMGLALLLVYLKTKALRTGDEHYNRAARFWGRIFGINFAVGVITGIPMEFQFGTNWAAFSKAAGGVIGQTLAMEGVFSFFLESSFLGLFLFGEKKLGRIGHWLSAFLVFLGSWLSGYFIVATDAWMQHPTGYRLGVNGEIELASFWDLLLNKWALWQYAHTMLGAVQTGCFVMAAVGAFYLLTKRDEIYGRTFVKAGVLVGAIAALLQLFPTGDMQGKLVANHQPVTLAAMEGLFESQRGSAAGDPRAARRGKKKARQSVGNSEHAQLPDVPAVARGREGLVRFSADGMAGSDSTALLQLSRDGGAGHDLHCSDGRGGAAVVARKIVRFAMDALDADAVRAAAVYCEHGGMDDRGIGTAALADLWIDAHGAGNLAARGGGKCVVYADRVYGVVHRTGDPMAVPVLPRN